MGFLTDWATQAPSLACFDQCFINSKLAHCGREMHICYISEWKHAKPPNRKTHLVFNSRSLVKFWVFVHRAPGPRWSAKWASTPDLFFSTCSVNVSHSAPRRQAIRHRPTFRSSSQPGPDQTSDLMPPSLPSRASIWARPHG